MDITGKTKLNFIKHNQYGCNASMSISKKQKDGTYISSYMPVSFNVEQAQLLPEGYQGQVKITGYLTANHYTNKEGKPVKEVKVICTNLELLEGQPEQPSPAQQKHFQQKQNGYAPAPQNSNDMPF